MPAVVFSHPDIGDLRIHFPPTSVQWTYNLNTNVIDTYAGQVIQLLSLNFDKFIIEGRFGKEGTHGLTADEKPRPIGQSQDFTHAAERGVGLAQMSSWFQAYFAVAGQGGPKAADGGLRGHFNQRVVTVTYDTDSDAIDAGAAGPQAQGKWKVYPVSFPSFKLSKENIAPEWHVECEVVEPDFALNRTSMIVELKRLEEIVSGFGYQPFNPYSDPLGPSVKRDKNGRLTQAMTKKFLDQIEAQLKIQNDELWDAWGQLIPAYNPDEINHLLFFGGSVPELRTNAGHGDPTPPTPKPKPGSRGAKPTPGVAGNPTGHGSHGGTGEPKSPNIPGGPNSTVGGPGFTPPGHTPAPSGYMWFAGNPDHDKQKWILLLTLPESLIWTDDQVNNFPPSMDPTFFTMYDYWFPDPSVVGADWSTRTAGLRGSAREVHRKVATPLEATHNLNITGWVVTRNTRDLDDLDMPPILGNMVPHL